MKNKFFYPILCVLLGLAFFIYCQTIKENYIANLKKLDESRFLHRFAFPFRDYIIDNEKNEYPETIEEALALLTDHYETDLKDYLSKKSKGKICYIPLYNPDNLRREAYIVLSAGFDGKINNRFDWNDTLFITDFQDRLKLYNPHDFYKLGGCIPLNKDIDFNIFSCFFGRKDYLIEYVNMFDFYKFIVDYTYSTEKLIDYFEKSPPSYKVVLAYKGVMSSDTIIANNRYILFRHEGYLIKNKLLHNEINIVPTDTTILIGTFKKFFNQSKTIEFVNCFQIDEEINR